MICLLQVKLFSSKRQAREDVSNGAVSVNGVREQDVNRIITAADRIEGQFTIIRRGKKRNIS
ncbi:hypothetical protein GCM10020331_031490 [Ectobacillus funiculus]